MDRLLASDLDLPSLEAHVIDHWHANDVPARFVEQRRGGPRWVTYEGPPTVNGKPALHHVWTTAFKDVYGRFHALRGKLVERKAGWDCQGLPIEIAVERELGISTKSEIEEYGVERFVERCRELVDGNIGGFEEVLRRVGYWVDFEDPYRTMDEPFIESVWWQLRRLHDKGLLYRGDKVLPYCIRCGTALSSHELGQPGVYRDVTDVSAFVAMPLVDDDGDRELVVWTTTPWTLPANVAVAVHPDRTYAVVAHDGRALVVLESLVEQLFGSDAQVVSTLPGAQLVGRTYERPFPQVDPGDGLSGVVVGWRETADDVGTGMVHIAPTFGEDDSQLGHEHGLARINPVGPDGCYVAGAPEQLVGRRVTDVDDDVVADLRARGRLVRTEAYTHSYPHCWRCSERLIYWAKPSWYLGTSTLRDQLVEENEHVEWHPATIKHGRFGNWLRNNVDWALSRDRFWGTPLPVWTCGEGHVTVVGSRHELGELAGRDLGAQRLHRPWIDEVEFDCPECARPARREPEVCDVWLDSGAMPAAQWGMPHVEGSEQAFEQQFPADFVCEAIDQTRGWFYSLLALNTMAFGSTPYRNVVCLGHLVDDEGRKMSKSLGNVIDPHDLLPRFGADGIRWFLLSTGAPWGSRRVSIDSMGQVVAKDLGTLWNIAMFWHQYATIAGWSPADADDASSAPATAIGDRWLLSRLESVTEEVTQAFERYESHRAAEELAGFVDELSNWYVRRSRRRFWQEDASALSTLHQVLQRVSILLAPFTPHLSEALYAGTHGHADSVHLADWPAPDPTIRYRQLEEQMAVARHAASIGHRVRAGEGLPVRQPLRAAIVSSPVSLDDEIVELLRDELNVLELTQVITGERKVSRRVEPDWRRLGPRFRDKMQAAGAAISELAGELVERLAGGESVPIDVDGTTIDLAPDDVRIVEVPLSGWASSEEDGTYLALDTELDDELRHQGAVRGLIRRIQVARREGGLEVTDRIRLWVDASFLGDAKLIGQEVLGVDVIDAAQLDGLTGEGRIAGEDFAFERLIGVEGSV